jgi:hypothetical protein
VTHLMLDLETLGIRPGCVVLSVGAVVFGREGVLDRFEAPILLSSCLELGLTVDADTLGWWAGREDRGPLIAACEGATTRALPAVLLRFHDFVRQRGGGPLCVWSNGADFDVPILQAAYDACRLPPPWGAYAARCYRTLKSLRPDIVAEGPKAHTALADAERQALHTIRLLDAVGGWPS